MSAQNTILLILAVSWSASALHEDCRRGCFGSWKTPEGCTDKCKYSAEWCSNADCDEVTFVVRASVLKPNRWVGIGFSKDKRTPKSDLVVGVMRNGNSLVEDRWAITSWRNSRIDKSQDIYNASFEHDSITGISTMRFTRKLKTEDDRNDIDLKCQYFIYAYGGMVRNNGIIKKEEFEEFSKKSVCLCSSTDRPTPPTPRRPRPPVERMCPLNCSISRENCQNDLQCRPLWNIYHRHCNNIVAWNGSGEPPVCSKECKEATKNLTFSPEGMLYTCCYCNNDACKQAKKNFKDRCGFTPEESSMCKGMNDMCDDNKRGTCQSCQSKELMCRSNATCKMLSDDVENNCKNILKWDESISESEPICTDECKKSIIRLQTLNNLQLNCCSCGKITDDRKLEDVSYAIGCYQRKRNVMKWCFNGKMQQPTCKECRHEDMMNRPQSCFNVMNMCLKDRSCKLLMRNMEKECHPVTTWNPRMEKPPVCSIKCRNANAKLLNHKIGRLWRACDCRKRNEFFSLSRNENFERNCMRGQNNIRAFCYYTPYRGIQHFKCDWLTRICSKDSSCKSLYDDREQKCASVFSWNEGKTVPPVCTDECKEANAKLMKHKIWEKNLPCDCGSFNNKALKKLEQTVRCNRRQMNMMLHCRGTFSGPVNKDPCEPESCLTAKAQCVKCNTCKVLYEDFEIKCANLWNATNGICSDECMNATYQLTKDPNGRSFKECDCGPYDNPSNSPQEIATIGKCLVRQSRMREICKFNDAGQCMKCAAKKICPQSCGRIISRCKNDTNCNIALKKYSTNCRNVTNWNISLSVPTCTDECKEAIINLRMNQIGRHLKCCKCDNDRQRRVDKDRDDDDDDDDHDHDHDNDNHDDDDDDDHDHDHDNDNHDDHDDDDDDDDHHHDDDDDDHDHDGNDDDDDGNECTYERRNIGFFCGIDFNNVEECQHDQKMCAMRDEEPREKDPMKGEIVMKRPRPPPTCYQWVTRCKENKCCSKAFHEVNYYCREVRIWRDSTTTPVCCNACVNALKVLDNDFIGKNIMHCDCGKFSNVDQNNFSELKHLEHCKITQRNMNRFCNASKLYHSQPKQGDKFKDTCAVGNCMELEERCKRNETCKQLLNSFQTKCGYFKSSLANISSRPTCSRDCKQAIDELFGSSFGHKLKCCDCGLYDPIPPVSPSMTVVKTCHMLRGIFEKYCNLTNDECVDCKSRVECQKNKKEYNNTRINHRDQCPPRSCEEWRQICSKNATCLKYKNEAIFSCLDIMHWQDGRPKPMCTPECQRAIDRLALVSKRISMGENMWCCDCGNFSTLRDNSLRNVEMMVECKRINRNMNMFCNMTCTDCNRKRPMEPSCKAATRMCNDISECRTMRNRVLSSCSNVAMWERGNNSRRPRCSNECRQALITMGDSRYSRSLHCCDCQHDDMTAMERRECQEHHHVHHRNFEEFCGIRHHDICHDDNHDHDHQQNTSRTTDCINHMERCNRDVRCRNYFFNYTDKCAREFSGEQMRPHHNNMCREAAKNLFNYKRFGENITRCECNAYPELCKDLFKNRFLLDRPCMLAEARCRNDSGCRALLQSHKNCRVMKGSCSWSCRAKAILLYRHRLGRNWWQLCRPHNFEQVCFTLY